MIACGRRNKGSCRSRQKERLRSPALRNLENAPSGRLHVVGGSSRQCPLGSVLRGALAIQTRAHRSQDLGHVPHQVVINLSVAHDHQLERPCAASAAWTYSEPKRQNRSRCSTTIRVTDGSRNNARNFRRCPFNAEPTSTTTLSTGICWSVAHAQTRATCRSRSAF